MAEMEKRLAGNAPGEFFVDSSCIDCDTCRRVAPKTFDRDDAVEQSVVARQPDGEAEMTRALMALVACPTASIGTEGRRDIRAGVRGFPEPLGDEIYYCGFTSKSSFGASSYLVRRPEGNVLVDSPRAAAPLVRKVGEMGGVRRLFLTHKDDVADHARFREAFGCERILHEGDMTPDTRGVERIIRGREAVPLADDLRGIPLPGHTRGSVALLYGDHTLFSGDHIWWSRRRGRLFASRQSCWYSWSEQIRSMESLLKYDFRQILPGHGDGKRFDSVPDARRAVEELISHMRRE